MFLFNYIFIFIQFRWPYYNMFINLVFTEFPIESNTQRNYMISSKTKQFYFLFFISCLHDTEKIKNQILRYVL